MIECIFQSDYAAILLRDDNEYSETFIPYMMEVQVPFLGQTHKEQIFTRNKEEACEKAKKIGMQLIATWTSRLTNTMQKLAESMN